MMGEDKAIRKMDRSHGGHKKSIPKSQETMIVEYVWRVVVAMDEDARKETPC